MNKNLRRVLSLVLVLVMLFSLSSTALALEISGEPKTDLVPLEPDVDVVPERTGRRLDAEEIDPSELNVPKLGEDPAIAEEENTLTAETLPYGLNDVVRVSIFLDKAATMDAGYATKGIGTNGAAITYRDSLKAQQRSVTAGIEAVTGSQLDVKWNLTLAVNAISANVRYGDIKAIESVPGVRSVELENRYEPQRDEINTSFTTKEMVFAAAAWAEGYTGAGSKVAIIDTGTNQDHISFDGDALLYAIDQLSGETGKTYTLMTADDVAEVASQLNSQADPQSAYKSAKIPYAYNYVDGGYVTDHDSDSQGEHGSHVSGIAAANRFIEKDGELVDAVSTVYAVGVAPDAQILTMKVFGQGGGAYDSDYMAAVEDAIVLGADSANLSLGSGNPGLSFSGSYQAVMDSLVDSGTVVAISAGNSYAWDSYLEDGAYGVYSDDVSFHTGGSPGTFINSLGVASADNVGMSGYYFLFSDGSMSIYSETYYSNQPMISLAGEIGYILVTTPGNEEADFAALKDVLQGKIGVCSRGSSSFYVKANAAAANGAAGTIIYNNTAGTISMNLTGYGYSAPVVSITMADGLLLKELGEEKELNGVTYYEGTLTVADTVFTENVNELKNVEISSFSSWGVPGSLVMKPEITAPGGNIWSVNGLFDDAYESMSGTSMAAPHVAGMAAVLGQYVKENGLESKTGLNKRTIINSLLMSTAVPMQPDGAYLSVLQQGAGLADVAAAAHAESYILMNEDATSGAADGKVKAELGQDAERTGAYSYTFTITNIADESRDYALNTHIFTQGVFTYEGQDLLDYGVEFMDASVSYAGVTHEEKACDVDRNGMTDEFDAQRILDFLTGEADSNEVDSAVADFDGDGVVSTRDAYELLSWLQGHGTAYNDLLTVPAGESKTVTVNIQLNGLADLDASHPNGTYVEGYTYVTCVNETDDGAFKDVQHSIPILGYYGSWTDPGMFDRTSFEGDLYGTSKAPYFADRSGEQVNGMFVRYGSGDTVWFTGNPYALEAEYPADRLAVSDSVTFKTIRYNLLRNAGTSGWVAIGEDGSVLDSGALSGSVYGPYYYVNGGTWQNYGTRNDTVGKKVSELGLNEGDSFTLGFFAIPEYYALMLDPNASSGAVTAEQIGQLFSDGQLGSGAYVGHTFTVDNTAPVFGEAQVSEDKTQITINVQDNNYIAYLAILDLTGDNVLAGVVPEQTEKGGEVSYTFDLTGLELGVAVAAFAADYAGNEKAVVVRVEEGDLVVKTPYYKLTDTIVPGGEYLIANTAEAGGGYVLRSDGANSLTNSQAVTVVTDENSTYIPLDAVDKKSVWLAGEGGTFQNVDNGAVLGYYQSGYPFASWANPGYADPFVYDAETHYLAVDGGGYMMFYGGSFYYYTSPSEIFLYEKTIKEEPFDPDNASAVTVTPEAATLILDVVPNVSLSVGVEPLVLGDKSVTWSSSDENVATVDQDGFVTAVGLGTAVITAESNATPGVAGTCQINVTAGESMDAVVYGQVAFSNDDVQFAEINLNDMSVTNLSGDNAFSYFYGGGRAGNYVYGNDIDNDFHRYDVSKDYAYDSDYHYVTDDAYALIDAANMPAWTATFGEGDSASEEEYVFDLCGVTRDSKFMMNLGTDGSFFNLSSIANFVAVTYVGSFTRSDGNPQLYYYMLADDGTLYVFAPYGTEGGGLSAGYGEVCKINVLSIGEDKTAYSMTSADYLYEGEDFVEGIFIADNNSKGIYFVDLSNLDSEATDLEEVDAHFVGKINGAVNLSTLYDTAYDTAESIEGRVISQTMVARLNACMTGEVLIAETIGQPETESLDPAAEENIAAEPEAEAYFEEESDFEIVEVTEPEFQADEDMEVLELNGSLNAVRGYTPAARVRSTALTAAKADLNESAASAEEIDPSAPVIVLTEEVPANNGLYSVKYDPAVLTYSKTECGNAYFSIHADEENGEIIIAFADIDAVAAGNAIASISFEPACETSTVSAQTIERNDELALTEEASIEVPGLGHVWGEPAYEWAADNSSVTAVAVCTRYEDHILTETVNTSYEVVKAATCEEAGTGKYTAEFTNGEFATQTKEVEIPATGHAWGEPTYEWAEDNSSVTAAIVCANDESHVLITETVKTTSEITKAATCEEAGVEKFVAEFTNTEFEAQTKEVEIPATGHTWGEPTYEWAEDNSTVTAAVTCANDETHVVTETVDTVYEIVTAPTDSTEGVGTYTAEFTNDVFTTQTREKTIHATGWHKEDGKWHYYDQNGDPVKGWLKIDGQWYSFDENGVMQTGWQLVDGKWYFFNPGGTMATGWKELGGKWYYFNPGGNMAIGWKEISGKWYYFNTSGAMATGWKQIDGNWYHFEKGGSMTVGWRLIDGKYYCFDGSGVMVTGWKQSGGKMYYLDPNSGAMAVGWKKIDSEWYYFQSGGDMKTGWLKLNEKWYYFETTGVMLANTSKEINGKIYYFDANGVCTNP